MIEYDINATMLGYALIIFSIVTTVILYFYSKRSRVNIQLLPLLLKNFILGLIPFVGIISFFYFLKKMNKCV
jgi:hypothetical protein